MCRVLDGGLFTTVQDAGRVGFQRYGVPVSGAMDPFAFRAANLLVANPPDAACLEITLTGPEIVFDTGTLLAVTGADLSPRLDGRPIRLWRCVEARRGSCLTFGSRRDGVRAYLACAGGFDVPRVLGSRSTFTRSALGGLDGRALRSGDALPLGDTTLGHATGRHIDRRLVPRYGTDHEVRVVAGPQDDAFTEAGMAAFLGGGYTVSPQSDRIGCRLQGPLIAHRSSADIVSDGTAFGAVQVSGDGQPIVLMADRGTTGGYTKIATVISADLMRIAQAAPGDRVRFRAVTRAEAVAALREQVNGLASSAQRRDGVPFDKPEGPVYDEDGADAYLADASGALAEALDETSGQAR